MKLKKEIRLVLLSATKQNIEKLMNNLSKETKNNFEYNVFYCKACLFPNVSSVQANYGTKQYSNLINKDKDEK